MASAPEFVRLTFDDIAGWNEDNHSSALQAFRRGASVMAEHPPRTRALGIDGDALAAAVRKAAAFNGEADRIVARRFFEDEFTPYLVRPAGGAGFFTGYYEPIVAGSRSPEPPFVHPLYGVPGDLVEFDPADRPTGLGGLDRFARRTADGLAPYADRREIDAGFLAGRRLELVYLADPVEAFFIHIQGAARIRLAEGGTMRITYAAKNGHAYTPIGRVLVERGALTVGEATMGGIRAWLAAHPVEVAGILATNRSFIFFREVPGGDEDSGPIGAAKVPLAAGRSLAVDRQLYGFHLPVFVDTEVPDGIAARAFRRLMIAHDTGSAIVGPARGDIFFGSGSDAGTIAGAMRAKGRFIALVPRRGKFGPGAPP